MSNIPYVPTAEELAEVGHVINLDKFVMDPTKEWDPVRYSFSQNGIGVAPFGDIHVVKAPQKNGKTFLLTLLMGAMLKGSYLGLKCEIDNPRLLFIDTEQHPRDTTDVFRRVCLIAGIDGYQYHDRVRVLHMRGEQVATIRQAILQEIVFYKPDMVYIDGLVDCVIDPNDQAESKAYITELSRLALTHDCSIWTVLHVNPGTDKMRGHLGTILAQKSSDVLQCLKEKMPDGSAIFTVEQTDTRHKDINKFSFCIEDRLDNRGRVQALPVEVYVAVKEKTKLDDMMREVFAVGPMRAKDLILRIMEVGKVKQSKAYNLKNDAENWGIIEQDQIKTFTYHYVGLDLPNEEKAPF